METETKADSESQRKIRCKCAGVRYMFVVAGFLGMCIMYALRVNMSIAIIAMVNMTAVNPHLDNLTHEPMCAVFNPPLETSHMEFAQVHNGEFFWTPKLQGVIIGSFYYGYSISQVPGARLAEIYSGKWIFGLGTGISALLSLLIPIAAYFHIAALIFIRALQGLAQGVTFPAMYNLLGRWIREEEKTLVEAIVISGINIGTVIGMPLAAKLSNSDVFGGWPSAFYVIGIIGCIWFLFWSTFVTNSPSEQPCITAKELAHIGTKEIDHSKKPIPWLKILTFRPFWAAAFAQLVGDWTFFLLLNNLPTFYSTILNFNIETNGYMASFPYVLQSAVGCFGGYISDEAIKHGIVTPIFARKVCNLLACFGSVMGLILSGIAGCDIVTQITAFGLTMAFGGFWYCSYMISYLDMSPEYAGTLIGIASTVSGVTGFLTPIFVGALTNKKPTFGQWRIVFGVTIILLILNAIVYQFFTTADRQNWDDDHHTERVKRWREYVRRFFSNEQKRTKEKENDSK